MSARIGVVGLGRMGSAMARRLIGADFDVRVHNRTHEKAASLEALGAHWCDTPGELASQVDLAITMVADDKALLDVLSGPDGLLSGATGPLTLMDTSTISPATSAAIAAACGDMVAYLRAPVSGSTSLAANGSLTILVSGPKERFDAWHYLLGSLGSVVFYLGGGEEARTMKLALNMVVATTMTALGEALVLGERSGLDWQLMLEIFAKSAVGSPLVKYKADPLSRRDFSPAFTTAMMIKDLDLALDLGKHLGVVAPTTAMSRQLLQSAVGMGFGQRDFASVVELLERLSDRVPIADETDG